MNLFEKIDLFYKKAQELKEVSLDDKGLSGKPIIPSKMVPEGGGYPHALIRAAARSVLTKLISNPSVPISEKKDFNKLGDYLRDFLNDRFSDKDLNNQWGSYLSVLMKMINHLKKDALDEDLGNFYQSLYDIFNGVWESINSIQAWKTNVIKPEATDWIGAAKSWGNETNQQLEEIAKKKVQETGEEVPLKPVTLTSRRDRLSKLAKLIKKTPYKS